MRVLFSKFVIALFVLCAVATVFAQKPGPKASPKPKDKSDCPEDKEKSDKEKLDKEESDKNEANAKTTENVVVAFCGGSGNVYVRGWDKSEVRAVSEKGSKLKFVATNANRDEGPATQVKIFLWDEDSPEDNFSPCNGSSEIEIFVPRGAYVDLKTSEGDINIENVNKAHLQSLSGSFSLRGVKSDTRAETTSGDITLDDSSGQVYLNAISGSIDVRNVKQNEGADSFKIKAQSGDISLERVNYLSVEASSVSGDVTWFGALARGATYKLNTVSGDVTVVLPSDSSFTVKATVMQGGEIISDFQIKTASTVEVKRGPRQLKGTYGTGDATLDLIAVNGTVYLRKK